MQEFVQACLNLGSPQRHAEAEQCLLALRASPSGVDLALQILQTANQSQLVLFHASLLLRDAAIRQFSLQRSNLLLKTLLDLSQQRNRATGADAMLQTCAALFKRAFVENSMDVNAQIVDCAVGMLNQPNLTWHGAKLVLYILWEFSITTGRTTALGQAMDFHLKCGRAFHDSQFLLRLFVKCAQVLWSSSQNEDTDTLVTLLDVLDVVLNWPFAMFQSSSVQSDNKRIDPGREWQFLLGQDFIQALLGFLHRHSTHRVIKARVHQLLLSLCCLSGTVFGNEPVTATQLLIAHSLEMCKIGFALVSQSSNKPLNEDEEDSDLLDGCLIVSRALTIPRLDLLVTLVQQFPQLVPLTLSISEQCRALCLERRIAYAKHVLGEAMTSLLTVWVLLSTRDNLPMEIRQSTYQIFASLLETKLVAAPVESMGEDEDDEDGEEDDEENNGDEFLHDLASLARVNLGKSLQLVSSCLKQHPILAYTPEARCESMSFQVELVARILADPDEGETPELPVAVLRSTVEDRQVGFQAALELLQVFQRETTVNLNQVSPFLSETMLRAVRIWTATYLYSEQQHAIAEFAPFTQANSQIAAEIQQTIVHCACIHLQHFGGEERVGRASVALLQTVAARRIGNAYAIANCRAWQDLFQAYIASLKSSKWTPLHLVSAASHGSLVGVLTSTCSNVHEFNTVIFAPLYDRLQRTKRSGSDAVRLAELFRGVAKSQVDNSDVAYRVRECIAASLKEILALCGENDQDVLLSVLSVFSDFCEVHLSLCESALIPEIYSTCAILVQMFAASFQRVQVVSTAHEIELEFKAESLNKVLKLLISLSDRNYLDFSGSDTTNNGAEDDPSNVVLLGINTILPLVGVEMFQLSTVVNSFFDLVCGMCRLRAEYVSQLPTPLFASIVRSMNFGFQHHDAKIQRACLESIASLCKAQTDSSALAQQLQVMPNLFFDWQVALLELVMTSTDMVGSTLDCVASALLAATWCSPQSFTQAVNQVCTKAMSQKREGPLIDPNVEQQRLSVLQQTLSNEFSKLFQGVRIEGGDRTDKKRFSSNVQAFAKTVRGFVFVM